MSTVIVHGPQASGKTRNAAALAELFLCEVVIDGWTNADRVVPGALHLTSDEPDANLRGVLVIGIEQALAHLNRRNPWNVLVMLGLAPLSWRLGVVRRKAEKTVWSFGPLRLSVHRLGVSQ